MEQRLQERIKELGCLYAAGRIAAESGPLEPLIERITQILPSGFQHPELVGARIRVRDQEFRTRDFRPGEWGLKQPLFLMGESVGEITVSYRAQPPQPERAFLKEESDLLQGIADLIASTVRRCDTLRALHESEERWRLAINALAEGVIVQTVAGKVVVTNAAAQHILGLSEEELNRMSCPNPYWEAVCEDGSAIPDNDYPIVVALRKHEPTIDRIIGLRHADGRRIWLSLSAQPLYREGESEPYAVVASFNDITDRKAAEAALRESEQRLKQIMELSPIGIGIAKGLGVLVDANDTLLDLLGYSRAELLAGELQWQSVLPSNRHDAAGLALADASQGRSPQPIESACIRKDGSHVPALVGVRHMQGHEDLVICYVIDLTERKKAEEKIAFQAHLLNIAGRAITACDLNGRLTYYNRYAEILFGWRPDEMIGHYFTEVAPPESRPTLEQMHAAAFSSHGLSGDIELVNRDGRKFLASITLRPITGRQGEVTGVVAVSTDITERKKIEEALGRMEKLEAIGVLAGGIAHDFNNILTAVLGNVGLARLRVSQDKETDRLLEEAEKAGWRARALTQQFVTFAQGGAPMRKIGAIAPLLNEVPALILRGSNIAVSVDVPADLWSANFDETQISQVLQILVQNAREAMPGGGRLTIRARNTELNLGELSGLLPGRHVRIDISDTGTGIPRDIIGKIFDPYFSTKREGTGLGLATAYSIIKRHEGTIEVESEPGHGAKFSLYLPAFVETNLAETRPSIHGKPAKRGPNGKVRILLMDDEDMVRNVGARMLEGLGYEVECAREGDEALSLYRSAQAGNKPFAAVILDLTVPGAMGGKDCIAHLKTLNPDIKALVSSGYGADPVLADFSAYGFSGMIPKPYRLDELRDTLRAILGT